MESKLDIINCNTGFQPLVECWLGDCYRPDFFDYIENDSVRNVLRQITEETIEDLENIREVLESYNVTVKRPKIFGFEQIYNVYKVGRKCLDDNLEVRKDLVLQKWPKFKDINGITEYLDSYDIHKFPGDLTSPPLFPRDEQIIIGSTIYRLTRKDVYKESIGDLPATQAALEHLFDDLKKYAGNIIDNLPFANSNDAPSIVRLGDTIILDGLPIDIYKYFKKQLKDYTIITAYNDGHSDGIYNPIKPGVWISNGEALNFKKYFPSWDVYYLPDAQWSDMSPFLEVRDKVKGKWWIPGEEHNDDLISFVDNWFSDWVGFCEETVWDVNVLVINPETVLCLSENKDLFKWLRSHHIEPIVAPFRHRFFWDGGLHCLTLDIRREGGIESYAR